jgi:heme/copper-type cytochrome/quinol oxidase subunit 4
VADAMTNAAANSDDRPSGALPIAAAFLFLLALTAGELFVVMGLDAGRPARITALAGLLMAKVGAVLSFFMHARRSRRASWFALVAIVFAAGAGVVLLLETAYRVQVQ